MAIQGEFLVKHRSHLTETKFSSQNPHGCGFLLHVFLLLLLKICFNKLSIIRSYRKILTVKRNLWIEALYTLLTFFHCKCQNRKKKMEPMKRIFNIKILEHCTKMKIKSTFERFTTENRSKLHVMYPFKKKKKLWLSNKRWNMPWWDNLVTGIGKKWLWSR